MKHPIHFRLSEEALRILNACAKEHGLTRTGMLELMIRRLGQEQGQDTTRLADMQRKGR